ncbi:MAG TPA: hypothetical protein VLL52_22210 [Anaerolineae bacterium]|nr:hypothetical protein [Anaerolineae bacterium]
MSDERVSDDGRIERLMKWGEEVMKKKRSERVHITIVSSSIIVVTIVVLVVVLGCGGGCQDEKLALIILVSGAIGGGVNNIIRFQDRLAFEAGANSSKQRVFYVESENSPEVIALKRWRSIRIYLAPFIGGIFAFVLYILFMAGFIEGTFFPQFEGVGEAYTGFVDFASGTRPATNSDMAKALIWAFLAGFSERIVPTFLAEVEKAGKG